MEGKLGDGFTDLTFKDSFDQLCGEQYAISDHSRRNVDIGGGNAEMHSHPAQYDADCFRPDILFLPHREFLLLTNEKKPKTVIHDDISLSHGGGE